MPGPSGSLILPDTFLRALGDASAAIGQRPFYRKLAAAVGELVVADWRLVMRYTRFSAPDFLVAEGIDSRAVRLYQDGYYRFDPFYTHWRRHGRLGVVSLYNVIRRPLMNPEYFSAIYRQKRIEDETAMFLPAPGRASVSLFWGRADVEFSSEEMHALEALYPIIAGLHQAHLDRILTAVRNQRVDGVLPEAPRAALIVDRDGQRMLASDDWLSVERQQPSALEQALARLADDESSSVDIGGGLVLHADRLHASFPIAPQGRIYFLESAAMTPIVADWELARERFARDHELTPREQQIVNLVLGGCPTDEIAGRLGIGRGTVKNHRRRLYRKLEISTEREIYTEFLRYLTGAAQPR